MTKHTQQEVLDAVNQHGTQKKAAEALGINIRTLERRLKSIALSGVVPQWGLSESVPAPYQMGKITVQHNKNGDVVNTWERYHPNAKQIEEMMHEWIQEITADMPRLPRIKHSGVKTDSDKLATYIFGDPHFGMLSWNDETGENWNLEIAKKVHCDAMADLVSRAPATERALIINLGDALHYDAMEPKTPRSGHTVDADGRFRRMTRVAFAAFRTMIDEALRKHKYVDVKSLQGNHDESAGQQLADMLAIAYENNPRVTVCESPSLFRYYRWENNLIGMHHGHTCKPAGLPAVMQTDMRKDFAMTDNHYWHVGHFHHAERKEYSDCIVEIHQTLAARDAYAHNGGWRSKRSACCVVYDKQDGEVSRIYSYAKHAA